MAGLIPFNRSGFGSMSPFASEFHNMLDDFFSDNWLQRRSLTHDTFKLDVKDGEKEYAIEAELPGVKKDEISLSLEDGCLTLSVNRKEDANEETKNYIHRERRFTSMQRSIYLVDADNENVSARLEEGILHISVPKLVNPSVTRQIEIQ